MKERKRKLDLQFFDDGDTDASALNLDPTPAVEPTLEPEPTPEPDPEPEVEPKPDTSEKDEELVRLKRALEQERNARSKAEKAAKQADLKAKQSNMEKMTEQERLEEERKQLEEEKREYALKLAEADAREVLSGAALKAEDYEPILHGVVTEDRDETKETAQALVDLITKVKVDTEKSVREKVMLETRKPDTKPIGEKEDTVADQIRKQLYGR